MIRTGLDKVEQMLERIFSSKYTFYAFAGFIYGGLIIAAFEILHHEHEERIVREYLVKEVKKLESKTKFRWHSYDMRIWCADAEEENWKINWKCPNIDEIRDLTGSKDKK